MTIEIPADLQTFVNEQLALGGFRSEEQLVADALRLLKAEHEETLEGIRLCLADVAAGRVQPLAEAFAGDLDYAICALRPDTRQRRSE